MRHESPELSDQVSDGRRQERAIPSTIYAVTFSPRRSARSHQQPLTLPLAYGALIPALPSDNLCDIRIRCELSHSPRMVGAF